MIKILINAYAVSPNMGSEPGMGWNWITNIAQYCEVYVITESEFRDRNTEAIIPPRNYEQLNKYGLTKEQCSHIHFIFVNVGKDENDSNKIRQMCWNQGNWFFYPKYAKWQEKALIEARNIIEEHEINIIHQLNMAGFREPGMLYRINEERKKLGKKEIPIVWGPMAGFGSIPLKFMIPGGIKFTVFYLIKNTLNILQLLFHPRVRKMIASSRKVIAATPEMKQGIEKFHNVSVEHINETGCTSFTIENKHNFNNSDSFKILWVGRFIYTKQLNLALETISNLENINGLEFHIVGKGFNDKETSLMKYHAKQYGINVVCHWHGQIKNEEVQKLMQECDLFFFTSIFEATSTVILEAIQNQLPIVCFDRCGFGPIVDETIGIKISCKSPKQAVKDFADAIRHLEKNRDKLKEMSENCKKKQLDLSWKKKTEKMINIYNQILDNSPHIS